MQRFLTTSACASIVLLAGAVCGAQEPNPQMWDLYKQMWEGRWETTTATPNGQPATGKMTVEVILDGKAVLESSTWTAGDQVMELKTLVNWCPKRKSIVAHTADSWGGHSEGLITLVDGHERGATSFVNSDGTDDSNKWEITMVDRDTIKVKFTEGRFAGTEFNWKRKKN